MARPARPVRSLVAGLGLVSSESQGGGGREGGGDWTGRDPSSIHSFPATLLLKRLPSSALIISLFYNNNPITTNPLHSHSATVC